MQKGGVKGKNSKENIENFGPKELWVSLVGQKQQMDEQAYSIFINEILGIAQDSVQQFYIMAIGMKTPKLGHILYQNFQHLFTFANRSKTVKDLKKLLPKFEKDLNDPKIYKEMYNKVFQVFLIKNLTLDFQYAQALWQMLLKNTFKFAKQFKLYLQSLGNKKPQKCHKDLWQMMYEFSITVKNVEKDFSEADAWPVFLDNFVEFMKEQGLAK